MRTYTRSRAPSATYFFTVNLAERHGNDRLTQHIDALRDAFHVTKQAHPFVIEAMAVLPDHLHCLSRLPPDDNDFPMRWRLISFHRDVACGLYPAHWAAPLDRSDLAVGE